MIALIAVFRMELNISSLIACSELWMISSVIGAERAPGIARSTRDPGRRGKSGYRSSRDGGVPRRGRGPRARGDEPGQGLLPRTRGDEARPGAVLPRRRRAAHARRGRAADPDAALPP